MCGRGEREVNETGMGRARGVYGQGDCNYHDLHDSTGPGGAQNNYRAKRISESPRETDAVHVGRPITTGCPLAGLSSRTVDYRVVPIAAFESLTSTLLRRPPV
jgi:hypothetical protein